jgi:hypothetical protein
MSQRNLTLPPSGALTAVGEFVCLGSGWDVSGKEVAHLQGVDESTCRAACDKKADCTFNVYSSDSYWSSTQCWLKKLQQRPRWFHGAEFCGHQRV